jgi:DNA-binding NarL/FixJ family response regulator
MGTARSRPGPIRILLADDQPRALDALTALLATFDDVAVVATATNGTEMLRLAQEQRPDVVLLDVSVPGAHGLDTRRVKAMCPHLPVAVMTVHPRHLRVAEAAAADAALLKGASGDEIAAALRRLLDRGGPAGASASVPPGDEFPRMSS